MESAIIDSIMRDVCSGMPRGSTGGFMDGSTCYSICANYLTGNQVDTEKLNRGCSLAEKTIKPHEYCF